MKLHIRRRYAVGVALALTAAIATSGAVFAYWTSTGAGAGSASAAASAATLNVTVNGGLTPMYPGLAAQTIGGTVSNPGPASVFVRTITVSMTTVTLAAGAVGTCSVADFRLVNPVVTLNTELVAGPGTTWSGPTIQFYDDPANNQDGCKGATVNLAAAAQ